MPSTVISKLGLERPIIFFDTETTGLNIQNDRIIQLAYMKYLPDSDKCSQEILYFNPEMPIPPFATAVHGITDDQVQDAPLFKDKAKELLEIFSNCFYSGFNIAGFDLLLLRQEFSRAGENFSYQNADIIDSKTIFHNFEQRNLASAYSFYCNKEHAEAHDAMADTRVSAEVLAAQIDRYGAEEIKQVQINSTQDNFDIDGRFYWKDGQLYFSFSKHRHRSLAEVAEKEPTFLDWMLAQDFSDEVKGAVKGALKGKFPTR
jgi:DNA polymerase-3 subunit epsilon